MSIHRRLLSEDEKQSLVDGSGKIGTITPLKEFKPFTLGPHGRLFTYEKVIRETMPTLDSPHSHHMVQWLSLFTSFMEQRAKAGKTLPDDFEQLRFPKKLDVLTEILDIRSICDVGSGVTCKLLTAMSKILPRDRIQLHAVDMEEENEQLIRGGRDTVPHA